MDPEHGHAVEANGIPAFVTIADLAKALQLSPRTLRRFIADGKAPPIVRLGRSVRFQLSDVKRWIESGCREAEAHPRNGGLKVETRTSTRPGRPSEGQAGPKLKAPPAL